MLSALSITKAVDENGHEITPEIAFDVGLTAYVVFDLQLPGSQFPDIFSRDAFSKPKDFKCVIAPRSEKAKSLVMQAAVFRSAVV